jgi:hypothetical protein
MQAKATAKPATGTALAIGPLAFARYSRQASQEFLAKFTDWSAAALHFTEKVKHLSPPPGRQYAYWPPLDLARAQPLWT